MYSGLSCSVQNLPRPGRHHTVEHVLGDLVAEAPDHDSTLTFDIKDARIRLSSVGRLSSIKECCPTGALPGLPSRAGLPALARFTSGRSATVDPPGRTRNSRALGVGTSPEGPRTSRCRSCAVLVRHQPSSA